MSRAKYEAARIHENAGHFGRYSGSYPFSASLSFTRAPVRRIVRS